MGKNKLGNSRQDKSFGADFQRFYEAGVRPDNPSGKIGDRIKKVEHDKAQEKVERVVFNGLPDERLADEK